MVLVLVLGLCVECWMWVLDVRGVGCTGGWGLWFGVWEVGVMGKKVMGKRVMGKGLMVEGLRIMAYGEGF